MFLRLFTYQCKIIFRVKELIFWTLLFPIALCTFMYLAFSNIFETTEKAGNIPVAIVAEQENAAASMMFEELSKGDEALLKVQKMTAEEADKALENGGVKGIYYTASSLRLKVKETGMEQTILQMISKQYDQNKTLLMEVGSRHPEKLQEVIQTIQTQKSACLLYTSPSNSTDKIKYYSDNPAVARINKRGKIYANRVGQATVYGETSNGQVGYADVLVVTLNRRSLPLRLYDTETLRVNEISTGVTWHSQNPLIASVDSTGKVVGRRRGVTRIYATVRGLKLSCKVTVSDING